MKKYRCSFRWLFAAVLAGGLGFTASADAAQIGINFTRTDRNVQVTQDAFGVAASDWINLAPANASTTYPAVSVAGGSLTIVTSAANYWNTTSTASTGEQQVTHDYVDDGGTHNVTISGLSSILGAGESYSITLIMASADGNSGGFVTSTVTSGASTLGTLTPGTRIQAYTDNAQAAYALTDTLAGLQADSIKIQPGNRDTTLIKRASFGGVIITTVPEPGTLSLLVLGGLSLLRRRRPV